MQPPEKKYPRHSWTADGSQNAVIKKTDLSFFKYNATALPAYVKEYFSAENMSRGDRKDIVLICDGNRYQAYIARGTRDQTNTRMFWKIDLGENFKM
jgi:hypothetical protein